MKYTTEYLARMLHRARKTKGLSQRLLGTMTAVPQGHISRIENGEVDIRVSSLIELARALDLEPMLVPRAAVPAVESIIQGSLEDTELPGGPALQTRRELRRLDARTGDLMRSHPQAGELAQLRHQVRGLLQVRVPRRSLVVIQDAAKAVHAFQHNTQQRAGLRDALSQLRSLHNALTHGTADEAGSKEARPAYRLDEDGHD